MLSILSVLLKKRKKSREKNNEHNFYKKYKMKKTKLFSIVATIFLMVSCAESNEKEETANASSNSESNEISVDGEYALDTSSSVLKWKGWEGPKERNHNHYGTMKFSNGKINMKGNEIIEGKFSLSLSSIYVEDLSEGKKGILKKHLMAEKFFNAALFPDILVKILRSKDGIADVEIGILGKTIQTKVPLVVSMNEKGLRINAEKFEVDFKEIGVRGFEPDLKDPNESISPVIEFDLDLIFSQK